MEKKILKDKVEQYNNGLLNADQIDFIIRQANKEEQETVYLVSYDKEGKATLHHYLK